MQPGAESHKSQGTYFFFAKKNKAADRSYFDFRYCGGRKYSYAWMSESFWKDF
jgi:hypothetical protein